MGFSLGISGLIGITRKRGGIPTVLSETEGAAGEIRRMFGSGHIVRSFKADISFLQAPHVRMGGRGAMSDKHMNRVSKEEDNE